MERRRREIADFVGLMRGYRRQFGDAKPGTVLQLGAGGVGLATAFGLHGLAADNILIHDKNVARGEELVATLRAADANAPFITEDALIDAVLSADELINCTPMETAFLRSVAKSRIEVMAGFELLFFLGIEAFEVFSRAEIDAGAARTE